MHLEQLLYTHEAAARWRSRVSAGSGAGAGAGCGGGAGGGGDGGVTGGDGQLKLKLKSQEANNPMHAPVLEAGAGAGAAAEAAAAAGTGGCAPSTSISTASTAELQLTLVAAGTFDGIEIPEAAISSTPAISSTTNSRHRGDGGRGGGCWACVPHPARRLLTQSLLQLAAVCLLFSLTHGAYLTRGVALATDPPRGSNFNFNVTRQQATGGGEPMVVGGEPMVIGHRGVWMRGVPENSFEAADLAKSYGFHGVEFDVRLTSDKVLVVMHDDTLDRTTTGTGFVKHRTLAQLKELVLTDDDGGRSKAGETVPTLREYLDYLKRIDMIAEVELKQGYDSDVMVAGSLDEICRAGMRNMSFIATCEYHYQSILAAIAPGITLERDYLYHTSANSLTVPANANILGISGIFLLFNPWVVPNSHRAGQVYCYTDAPPFFRTPTAHRSSAQN